MDEEEGAGAFVAGAAGFLMLKSSGSSWVDCCSVVVVVVVVIGAVAICWICAEIERTIRVLN